MRILILGGRVFLGRHLVEAAQARGHEITLFNRGKSSPELFPDIDQINGDRDGQIDRLGDRTWDAVIDTCGYVPRVVDLSARYLADRTKHYTFVSTVSVYADFKETDIDESYPVGTLAEPTEEVTGESYGPLKALCEEAALSALPGRVFIPRPGLIVGPHDPTHRFTYWPERVDRGGEILAPLPKEEPQQTIDVRDLAEWIVRMVEGNKVGIYNACGLEEPFSMETLLETCRTVSGVGAEFTWVDGSFLVEQEVGAWMELPLWIPAEPDSVGFSRISIAKALAEGMTFRTLERTVRDTLEWNKTLEPGKRRAGLDPEKEAKVLAAWHARTQES